jgi:hypothetical protein
VYWTLYVWMLDPGGRPGEGWWKAVALCPDAESAGIVTRALEAGGQRVREGGPAAGQGSVGPAPSP